MRTSLNPVASWESSTQCRAHATGEIRQHLLAGDLVASPRMSSSVRPVTSMAMMSGSGSSGLDVNVVSVFRAGDRDGDVVAAGGGVEAEVEVGERSGVVRKREWCHAPSRSGVRSTRSPILEDVELAEEPSVGLRIDDVEVGFDFGTRAVVDEPAPPLTSMSNESAPGAIEVSFSSSDRGSAALFGAANIEIDGRYRAPRQ